MAKKQKKKKQNRGPNEQIAIVPCPGCGRETGALRLTHLKKAPYIRCLECTSGTWGGHGIALFFEAMPRARIEPMPGVSIRDVMARVTPYLLTLQAVQKKARVNLDKPENKDNIGYTPILARLPCPCCGENFAVVRLTAKNQKPYIRCYFCFMKLDGSLGVHDYLSRKSRSITYLALKKRDFWDVLDIAKMQKIETRTRALEREKAKADTPLT